MAKIKLSDYIAKFLLKNNIHHVFAITGGASLHLIHSVENLDGISLVCPHHEQAAAMAAEAYSRSTGNIGCAMATSGPGATNLITGICSAYYDSIPVLYLTGQVSTFRLKRDTGVRQFGFQETETVQICKPVTKYAKMIEDPSRIRYELEKAIYIAKEGRPGPVLLDVPDNLQREMIDEDSLEGFLPDENDSNNEELERQVQLVINLLRKSKRPVAIFGAGIRLSGGQEKSVTLAKKLNIPILPTWGAIELLPSDQVVGTFGLHGTRYGNFAIQNADLVISIGSRLDTHETGSPISSFARGAKKVIVDIDPFELKKFPAFGMEVDISVLSDAKKFIECFLAVAEKEKFPDFSEWHGRIDDWKSRFSICPDIYLESSSVNPYVFVRKLSQLLPSDATIAIDTGCAVAWFMQAFEAKKGQHIFSSLNNTPMGYALPAAIGASIALGKKQVICLSGDGGIQMNIQELATIMHHELPIKIIVINNGGYSMIQQTQDQWLDSNYVGSSKQGGLSFPNFGLLAEAHCINSFKINKSNDLEQTLKEFLKSEGPALLDLVVDSKERVVPQVVFGRPIEDAGPLLDRETFLKQMIVEPLDVSKEL